MGITNCSVQRALLPLSPPTPASFAPAPCHPCCTTTLVSLPISRSFAGAVLNFAEPAWHVLPPREFPKAHKLLAVFLAFCRLAHPEVAERRAQDGAKKPRLATAAFCRRFCPGLAPFMQCFREGNVVRFRELQQRHAESLWRLGLTVSLPFFSGRLQPLL